LNYNGKAYIEQCLDSVLKSEYRNFEVILVDNASTDGSFELARKKFSSNDKIRFLSNESNLGYAEGINRGLKASSLAAEYIAILAVDTKVDTKWLKNLLLVAEKNEKIGITTSKVLQMDNPDRIDTAGGISDPLCFPYQRGVNASSDGFNEVDEIFYADGTVFLMRKTVAEEVKIMGSFFDPLYFCYYEDIDLCWRVRLRGYRIVLVPSSLVYHKRGGTSSKKEQPFLT